MIRILLVFIIVMQCSIYAKEIVENTAKNSVLLTKEEQKYLDTKSYLSVMNLENFQPFNFVQDNKPIGYSVDMVNLMGKYLHKEIRYVTKPWGEQLEMLKNGTLDVIPHIAINEKRNKFVDYTDFVHLNFLIGFATNNKNTITSIKDLEGKKLAVIKDSYLADYLTKSFPQIVLYEVANRQESVEAVATNKAFAVIGNIPTLSYFIDEKWLTNFKIVTIDDFGLPLETKMPMGVKKGNLLLKSILEKTYKTIPIKDRKQIKENWMNASINISNNLSKDEIHYLKNKKKILMCVLPDWLPFEEIDEQGKHKGIGADFMKIVSSYIDTPIELLPTKTWSESLKNIRERKCDILPVAMDVDSRKDTMNFTKPYVAEPFVVATKMDKFFIKDITELSNKKIGIVKNYAFMDVLKEKNTFIKIIGVNNTKEGLEMVRNGELFGYIDTLPTIGYAIQKYSMLDIKIAGKLNFDVTLSVASRNDEPLLDSIMQKALGTINEDHKRTIIGKWISIKVSQDFDYTTLLKISIIFIIILFVILYKNRAVSAINEKLSLANKDIEEQQKMVDKYVMILTTDLDGKITHVNEAYLSVIGYDALELIGKTHAIMKHPDMKKSFFVTMWKKIKTDNFWSGEIKNFTKDKKTVWFFMNVEPIFIDNIKIGYRSISQNITDEKIIEQLSITDQLTNLYNRHYLEKTFSVEMERSKRYEIPLSLILLDIDHFKVVNDTHGHEVGDNTLKSIAEILESTVRKVDCIGRWGGEEFIIITPNTTPQNAAILADKVRIAIENYEFSVVKKVTASFGVALYDKNDSRESFISKSDTALYRAKESGRNKVEIY